MKSQVTPLSSAGLGELVPLRGGLLAMALLCPPAAAHLDKIEDRLLLHWVVLNETRADGGIVGFLQDNGDFEKGWLLGYDRRGFSLTLATAGTDDGNGDLTRLTAKTAIEPGRWHHVAATYDGTTMRLYLDGRPEGESTAQSGDILYPQRGRYAIAAYADDNELNPMDGALFEVKVYGRALAAAEIAEVAAKNQSLLAWRSPVNQELQFVVRPYLQSTMGSTGMPAPLGMPGPSRDCCGSSDQAATGRRTYPDWIGMRTPDHRAARRRRRPSAA